MLRGSEKMEAQRVARKTDQNRSPSITKSTSKTPLSKVLPSTSAGNQMKNSSADMPNTANVFQNNFAFGNNQLASNSQTNASPSPLRKVTTYIPGTTTIVRIIGENDQRVSTPSATHSTHQTQSFPQHAPIPYQGKDQPNFGGPA